MSLVQVEGGKHGDHLDSFEGRRDRDFRGRDLSRQVCPTLSLGVSNTQEVCTTLSGVCLTLSVGVSNTWQVCTTPNRHVHDTHLDGFEGGRDRGIDRQNLALTVLYVPLTVLYVPSDCLICALTVLCVPNSSLRHTHLDGLEGGRDRGLRGRDFACRVRNDVRDLSSEFGTYKTVNAIYKTVKGTYKTVKARFRHLFEPFSVRTSSVVRG